MNEFYVESTESGHVWRVYAHKPQGRPAYATATEGISRPGSFECQYPQRRRAPVVPIAGPATAKKKDAAMRDVVAGLVSAGWVVVAEGVPA